MPECWRDQMWNAHFSAVFLLLPKRWWCINSVDNIMDFFFARSAVYILFPNWNMGFKDLCVFYIVLLWRNKVKLEGFCGFNTSAWICQPYFLCFSWSFRLKRISVWRSIARDLAHKSQARNIFDFICRRKIVSLQNFPFFPRRSKFVATSQP